MMKKVISLLLAVITALSLFAPCAPALTETVSIHPANESCLPAAQYLADCIKKACGLSLPISDEGSTVIELAVEGEELDYSVHCGGDSVLLTGGGSEALMRAVNSFLAYALSGGGNALRLDGGMEHSFRAADRTDNSSLLRYEGGENTALKPSLYGGYIESPAWLDSLIMVEIRPDTASIGGTLPECRDLIDHYARLGVNGIWLAPIYDRGADGNGYSNRGPHTVDPRITGETDYSAGWQRVREFVDYAHQKGIYVFLDVITWGVLYSAPLIDEHPDWFSGEAWGNTAFDWSNEEFKEWFITTLVNNIQVTGADGYRCDCEPNYAGEAVFAGVRKRLAEKGIRIALISENTSKRSGVFDLEQEGVFDYSSTDRGTLYASPENFFADGKLKIVESVQSGHGLGTPDFDRDPFMRGAGRNYTNCITNHDYQRRDVCGDRLRIGYSSILAPFIPIWYMGDEFNAPWVPAVQYDIPVDFSCINRAENAFFLEDVAQMIRIRRTLSDIFETAALDHRSTAICEVPVEGLGTLQGYARFSGSKAAAVIGNNKEEAGTGVVTLPLKECGINNYKSYRITDLMTGRVIAEGSREEVQSFTAFLPAHHVGVFLVEGLGESGLPGFSLHRLVCGVREGICSVLLRLAAFFHP